MKVCFLSGIKEVTGQVEVELAYRGRLSGLIDALCIQYGQKFSRLVVDRGNPGERNPFLKILVDGEDVRNGDPDLVGNEMVFLFFPIAGG